MKTLYHGTSSVHLSEIKAIGLVPGHAKGGDAWAKEHHWHLAELAKQREPSVFVADEAKNASHFAHLAMEEVGGDPIVLTLHVPERVFATYLVDELFEDDGTPHAWRAHSVAPSYIGKVIPVDPNDVPGFEMMDALVRALSTLSMRIES